jgi:hypothetical protein
MTKATRGYWVDRTSKAPHPYWDQPQSWEERSAEIRSAAEREERAAFYAVDPYAQGFGGSDDSL